MASCGCSRPGNFVMLGATHGNCPAKPVGGIALSQRVVAGMDVLCRGVVRGRRRIGRGWAAWLVRAGLFYYCWRDLCKLKIF